MAATARDRERRVCRDSDPLCSLLVRVVQSAGRHGPAGPWDQPKKTRNASGWYRFVLLRVRLPNTLRLASDLGEATGFEGSLRDPGRVFGSGAALPCPAPRLLHVPPSCDVFSGDPFFCEYSRVHALSREVPRQRGRVVLHTGGLRARRVCSDGLHRNRKRGQDVSWTCRTRQDACR